MIVPWAECSEHERFTAGCLECVAGLGPYVARLEDALEDGFDEKMLAGARRALARWERQT